MINFSVIIPNYNHASFLSERIESVLAQTYPHFEIIILDDCSTDNSRDIIEHYSGHPKIQYVIYSEKNSGSPFKQWQKGIQLAKGNWIWVAESDDSCSPQFLEAAIAQITKNPEAGLYYCDAVIKDGSAGAEKTFAAEKNSYFNTLKWSSAYVVNGLAEINDCLGTRCTINNASSAVMRKYLLNSCINAAAGFKFHGDWYCYLAIAAKASVIYDPAPLNTYRAGSSGITAKLPADGRDKAECFRILLFVNSLLPKNDFRTRQFVLLNLNDRLGNLFRAWKQYAAIDPTLARKVLFILLTNRFSFRKQPVL